MPMYQTRCAGCQTTSTMRVNYSDYETVSKDGIPCVCGGAYSIVFDPSAVSFVLKDGESGGWVSKAQRENKYRAARRQVMGRREKDHVKPKSLIPNFNGQVANSWSEAKDEAYRSTYERVNREHGHRTASEAAKESAKTFDAHVKKESA